MEIEKRVKNRIKEIESFLKVSDEVGNLSYPRRSKLTNELFVLKRILSKDVSIKGKSMVITPTKDKIIKYLRNKEPRTNIQIASDLLLSCRNISITLKGLEKEGKTKRMIKNVTARNPQKWKLK